MKRLLWHMAVLVVLVRGVGPAKADYLYTPLDAPGAAATQAFGINDAGQIVGAFETGSLMGPRHGFLLNAGGYTQLDAPGAMAGTLASAINASGQIVGIWGGTTPSGFLFSGGNYTPINVPASFGLSVQSTQAYGINDRGQIVGGYTSLDYNRLPPPAIVQAGFLLSGGNYTNLTQIYNASANGINNAGQIVLSNGTQSGVLSGAMLTMLSVPGSTGTHAVGINNLGQLVGSYSDNSLGLPDHSFLYSDGNYTTFDVPGAIATVALGINDLGEIVGYYVDSSDNQHAFLATPTPEPGTFVLLCISLLGILGYAWRKRRAAAGVSA